MFNSWFYSVGPVSQHGFDAGRSSNSNSNSGSFIATAIAAAAASAAAEGEKIHQDTGDHGDKGRRKT